MPRLKLESFGTDCEGIRLKGNPKNPEPDHTRIAFPGGDVDVVRCTDGSYWVHIRVNHIDGDGDPDAVMAEITDARLDIIGRHTSDIDKGDFDADGLYHLAVRVSREK